jgi:hypothetical protein
MSKSFVARSGVGVLLVVAGVACRSPRTDETDPTGPSGHRVGACAEGGGRVTDTEAASFFPREAGHHCIDPNGETRSYGEHARLTLNEVCVQQFAGECEVYKRFGLRRVVSVRYVDGAGGPGTVVVFLSRFDSREGAFGFYHWRILGPADPATLTLESTPGEVHGVLGAARAYVWKGQYVVELAYANELESPDALPVKARPVLAALTEALGQALPGEVVLPVEARHLPERDRIPHGFRYEMDDLLGVAGVGPGAIAHYQSGRRRFRKFALSRSDEDAAKDVVKMLRRIPGAKEVERPARAVVVIRTPSPADAGVIEWVITRQKAWVFGVSDEDLGRTLEQSREERAAIELPTAEKIEALERLVVSGG